jgi:muconolactone delta-isomerase
MEADTSKWLTKAEAAKALMVSRKTVERLARRGELTQGWRRVPGKRAMAVFDPSDVQRLKERSPSLARMLTDVRRSGPGPRALARIGKGVIELRIFLRREDLDKL